MKQFFLALALIILTTVYITVFNTAEPVPLVKPLASLPPTIGGFTMAGSQTFDAAMMKNLGVDHYIMRQYRDKQGYSLWLYIGYYESQTEGSLIHSPRHCLPGSGWNTLSSDRIEIPAPVQDGESVVVNEMILGKGMQKQLVHYWYQGRGRITANEYLDRFFMILDSLTRRRSDGALVRITSDADVLSDSLQKQQEFCHDLLAILNNYFCP